MILSISSDAKIKWDNLNQGYSTVLCIQINTHYYFGRIAKFSAIAFTKISKTNKQAHKTTTKTLNEHMQTLPTISFRFPTYLYKCHLGMNFW